VIAPPPPSWDVVLAQARTDLASGQFRQALTRAESLLRGELPAHGRAEATLVAADAAYALTAWDIAAQRYRQALSRSGTTPDGPRVAMALGWAEFRRGEHDAARRAWADVARRYPNDPRAPLALVLAAETASQAGDAAAASALLRDVIARYPSGPAAGIARLNRSMLALRDDREEDAVRDLRDVVSSRASVLDDRRRVAAALATPGAERDLDVHWMSANGAAGGPRLARSAASDTADPADDAPAASIDTIGGVRRFADLLLQDTSRPDAAPILHGVVLIAANEDPPIASALARRLADTFPSYPGTPAVLKRVVTAAAAAGRWSVARDAYEMLIARYPHHAPDGAAAVDIAEALVRTGAVAQARVALQRTLESGRAPEQAARALTLLAEINESAGDRPGALAAYERLRRDHPRAERTVESLLAHARLLEDSGRRHESRPLLEHVVQRADRPVSGEASYRLAEILSDEGQHAPAVEWYMSAAYLAAGTRWEPLALLAAGRSLTALRRTNEALVVYHKLLSPGENGDGYASTSNGTADALVEDGQRKSEAAYRAAEILRAEGRDADAVNMYLAAVDVAPGSPFEHQALLGAVQSLVAIGDHASAEVVYRRLRESSGTDPALVAEAQKALSNGAVRSPSVSEKASQ
jgi:TolA-binding protein